VTIAQRIVIVGGGAAGHAAARAYRDAGGGGELIMVTDDDRPPYERPVVSKELLRGEIDANEAALEIVSDLRIQYARAVALDTQARSVVLAGGERLEYDGCLLATGSRPVRIDLDDADHDRIFVLRSVADSLRLGAVVGPGASVFVIGSGFVACEAAASLRSLGAEVTLAGMETVPQAARLGPVVGERIAGWLADAGVRLQLDTTVTAMPDAAVVLMATGAEPRVELARDAGIRLSDDGAVVTDAQMRTTADTVYAAGDIAAAFNTAAGRALRVEHWGDALGHGEIAGRGLAGRPGVWDGVPGFWSTIGGHTLKHAAWGGGWEACSVHDHADGAWTARYTDGDGKLVGVLTHDRDTDYEQGRRQLAGSI
jgi:NADPH-dependent 2,4-dienoyl-CoA reductase/sulfur reductase-like enzyme